MSSAKFFNQGEYDKDTSDLSSENASIDVFQNKELEEGLNAVPASPRAPDLESGVICKKGTAVVIVFSCNSDASLGLFPLWLNTAVESRTASPEITCFFIIDLILFNFNDANMLIF